MIHVNGLCVYPNERVVTCNPKVKFRNMKVHLHLLLIVIVVNVRSLKNLVMCFAVGSTAMHFLR